MKKYTFLWSSERRKRFLWIVHDFCLIPCQEAFSYSHYFKGGVYIFLRLAYYYMWGPDWRQSLHAAQSFASLHSPRGDLLQSVNEQLEEVVCYFHPSQAWRIMFTMVHGLGNMAHALLFITIAQTKKEKISRNQDGTQTNGSTHHSSHIVL